MSARIATFPSTGRLPGTEHRIRSTAHTLHHDRSHHGWDRGTKPALHVVPPATVAFEVVDASGGQITPDSGPQAVAAMDPALVNPLTGPVYVEGAQPGDALRVEILELRPSGWGWTAIIPGFGLLADDFPDPALRHWEYDPSGRAPAVFGGGALVPIRPFPGTVGVAPAEPGHHSVLPPRRVGGNMDTRDLAAGSTLWLPVEVPGALFSLGDTHAAQGDGEVCGTAIESPMTAVVALGVEPGAAPAFPVFETRSAPRGPELRDGVLATTGIGPDLFAGARDAVRGSIELLGLRCGLDPADAYMLLSVAGDLRISEIVDAPNWVVTCSIPKAVLRA